MSAACTVDACESPGTFAKGLCQKHYNRIRRRGSACATNYCPGSIAERMRTKIDKQQDGCWVWTGSVDGHGYGQIREGGRGSPLIGAHRASYENAKGPIPNGLDLDHLCCNPRCVNPDHLEPVTRGENTRRGRARRAGEVLPPDLQ